MHMPTTELKEIYIDPRTDLREYEASVKAYRDIVNAVNTARMEGLEKGLDIPAIQKATGLTINEIREL